jgi:hypothetical protein
LETSCLPSLFFESCKQVCGVLSQASEVLRCSQLTHKTGGVPSGAARKLLALDQDDIGYSTFCQVIGNAATDNAAANNHYFGVTWQIRHNGPLGGFGGDISVTYYDI